MHDWCMSKVDVDPNNCWLWTGYIDPCGYGRDNAGYDGDVLAHRISYRLHVAPIPFDMEIDHLCRVRRCINPAHLQAVTHAENVKRGISGQVNGARQRAKTHCPKGHAYSGANLYVCPRGKRECRACRSEASQRSLARRRAREAVSA